MTVHPPTRSAAVGLNLPVDPSPATGSAESRARWLVLATVSLSQLAVVLDTTIVNIALPSAQLDLGFGDDARQWVVTGYAMAFGSLLLIGGRLADLLGRTRMFVTGLLGFSAASAVGGFASTFSVLVGARVAQGVFGALLAPAALSLLAVTFAGSPQRGRAFAVFGAVSGAGGAVGLLLGGVLSEYLSWRWCLFVNVPIAAVAVAGALRWLPGHTARPAGAGGPGMDVPGALLSVTGLVSVVFGLGTAERQGWTAPGTLTCVAAGVALLAVFVVVQRRVAHPLLPLRVLASRLRGGAFVAVAVVGAGTFGVFLFLTFFLATVLGYTPLQTGLAFLPLVAGIMVSSQVAPVVVDRIGVKVPVAVGFLAAAGGLLTWTALGVHSSFWAQIAPGLVVLGAGIGLVMSSAFAASTTGVRATDAGVASAMVNVSQQIGGAVATAVLSAVAASAAAGVLAGADPADPAVLLQASVTSYTTAFAWSAAVFAGGAVLTGLLLPHGRLPSHRPADR